MNRRPLTIEFTGLPNSGKTTLIHNLESSLLAQGINVQIMQEDAELVPKEIPKKTWIRNVWITFGQLQSLLEFHSPRLTSFCLTEDTVMHYFGQISYSNKMFAPKPNHRHF